MVATDLEVGWDDGRNVEAMMTAMLLLYAWN